MIIPVIQSIKEIGFKKAMVFHGLSGNGAGGMDEFSPVSESFVKARDIIDSGCAMDKLSQWVQSQNREPALGKRCLDSLIKLN